MTSQEVVQQQPRGAVGTLALRHNMDAAAMERTLMQTIFPDKQATREQVAALCIVANEYGLSPWLKQIYAFPDKKSGGIIPVVSIDGWSKIINEHPMFDGCDFHYVEQGDELLAIDCTMYRKDRSHPITIREWMVECNKNSPAWGTNKRRMLRHRAFVQCGRIAFGLGGIYDPEEADQIREVQAETVSQAPVNAYPRTLSEVAKARQIAPQVLTQQPEPERSAANEIIGHFEDPEQGGSAPADDPDADLFAPPLTEKATRKGGK